MATHGGRNSAKSQWQDVMRASHIGGKAMRDIRDDLEERANMVHEQITAAFGHYENLVQQLQRERDERMSDLKHTLAMLQRLMQFESNLVDTMVKLEPQQEPHSALADRIRAAG